MGILHAVTMRLRRGGVQAAGAWGTLLAVSAVTSAGIATAQGFPSRTITMVVGYTAGGPTDGVARTLAVDVSARLGQNIVIENKGGAGGSVAAGALAKAQPDGYSLLFASAGTYSYFRTLYKSLSYDPVKDIAPVVMIGTIPDVLLVSPKLPVTTLAELVAWAKANPGKLSVGDSGAGTIPHVVVAAFAQIAGIQVAHLHYRGAAGSVSDVLGGHIEAAAGAYTPQYDSMKALAVSWNVRMPQLPNVPTFRELGYDLTFGLSIGLAAPAGTPPDVIAKINGAVNEFLKGPRGKEISVKLGLQIVGGTPAEMRAFVDNEAAQIEPVLKSAKISID